MTTASNFAKAKHAEIALLACEGFITTAEVADSGCVYGRRWRATAKGLALLEARRDS